jgi:hypothetical protein
MQEPVDMGTAERAKQRKKKDKGEGAIGKQQKGRNINLKEKKNQGEAEKIVTSSNSCRHESAARDFDGAELRYQTGVLWRSSGRDNTKGVLSANLAAEGRGAALG